jgi:hypothetical protein
MWFKFDSIGTQKTSKTCYLVKINVVWLKVIGKGKGQREKKMGKISTSQLNLN